MRASSVTLERRTCSPSCSLHSARVFGALAGVGAVTVDFSSTSCGTTTWKVESTGPMPTAMLTMATKVSSEPSSAALRVSALCAGPRKGSKPFAPRTAVFRTPEMRSNIMAARSSSILESGRGSGSSMELLTAPSMFSTRVMISGLSQISVKCSHQSRSEASQKAMAPPRPFVTSPYLPVAKPA